MREKEEASGNEEHFCITNLPKNPRRRMKKKRKKKNQRDKRERRAKQDKREKPRDFLYVQSIQTLAVASGVEKLKDRKNDRQRKIAEKDEKTF